jgi:hypothetical protein
MTFEAASKELTGPKYKAMCSLASSPLHVKPLYDNSGTFKGYEHCSSMHENSRWVKDFTDENNPLKQLANEELLLVPNANRHQAFPKDCCFLLNNIFFAQGTGVPITDKILDVLKRVQPKRKDIDKYAIFGYDKNKQVIGRRGNPLTIDDDKLVEELVNLIKSNNPNSQTTTKDSKKYQLKSCTCR